MATILHISDLHFGWPYVPEVGDAVHRAIDETAPDAVVVSGDLVQRGDFERLWLEAKRFLARITRPKLVIPGNHDIPLWNPLRRLLAPFTHFRRHIAPELDPVLHLPGAVIAGISTPRFWTVDLGFVSRGQLARVRRAFEAATPGALRVVTMHHGLVPQARAGLARHHVRGHARAARELAAMGADVVLSGHNHYPHVVEILPDGAGRAIVCAQAGTACSKRLRPAKGCVPQSVSIVRSRGRRFSVELHYFCAEERAFRPAERHEFDRPFAGAAVPV